MRVFFAIFFFFVLTSGCSVIHKRTQETRHIEVFNPRMGNFYKWTWHETERYEYSPFKDPDGSKILWHTGVFYRNFENPSWERGDHYFFGELVMRAYGLTRKGKPIEHWIEVKKDDKWSLVKINSPEFKFIKDSSGKLIAVVVVLKDENDKEIARSREIKRRF